MATIKYKDENGQWREIAIGGGVSVEVVNSLDSESTTAALSANQGRVLNESKQDALVSGTNIKTINNQSILGSGNIIIEGGGGGGVAELMTATTWADLVALRDAGNLVAGMKYRITDYETKTSKAGSQSAGHPFDIIVTALDGSTLDEKASAIQSARDTDGYFANSNLEAWDVRYCLDNDTKRFDWAVNAGTYLIVDISELVGGTIQAVPSGTFEYEGTTYYKWDAYLSGMLIYLLTINASPAVGETASICVPENSMVVGSGSVVSLTESTDNGFGVIYRLIDEKKNDVPYDFKNIQFVRKITDGALDLKNGIDTYCYTFSDFSTGALLDASESSQANIDNKFGAFCWDNVFLGVNNYNTFGRICDSNTFGNNCDSNTFGDSCNSNTFGDNCISNTFGNYCNSNTFGNNCTTNTFGNYCLSNALGYNCDSNTFGNNCDSNTFGNNCTTNAFGNNCDSNTFGNYCNSNTFGNNCTTNTFGDNCLSNTFGNYCDSNTFGNYCFTNTFGNYCDSNAFGTADAPLSSIQYYKVDCVSNAEIAATASRNFVTFVTKNSNGDVVQYTIDDIINA